MAEPNSPPVPADRIQTVEPVLSDHSPAAPAPASVPLPHQTDLVSGQPVADASLGPPSAAVTPLPAEPQTNNQTTETQLPNSNDELHRPQRPSSPPPTNAPQSRSPAPDTDAPPTPTTSASASATPACATPAATSPECASIDPTPDSSAAVDSAPQPDKTESLPVAHDHEHASPKDVADSAAIPETKPEVIIEPRSDSTPPNSALKRKLDSPHSDESPSKKPKQNFDSQQCVTPRNTRSHHLSPQRQKPASQSPVRPSPPKPTANSMSSADRPTPKNLPKSVKNRPDNARVFIGNLASEYTDVSEIIRVFHQYGDLIEEPVLRRSFGFVQYSSAEAASRAVAGEQGRIIGGIGIDLSIADNREVKRGTHVANNTPFGQMAHAKPTIRGRPREREFTPQSIEKTDRSRKRRRSLSPASAAKKGGVHPPQYRRTRPDPKNGVYLRILCMSPTARAYARHCENTFRSMTGLDADVLHIVAAGLGEALGRAMRDVIPYVMVVASKDVDDGTCTIRTLEKTGYEKSGRGNGVIPLCEAVEVCLIERGVIAPQNIAQQLGGPGGHGGMSRMGPSGGNSRGGRHPQHGMGSHGRQWSGPHAGQGNPPMETAKPGWMTGPRAPHPSHPRMAPSAAGMNQAPHGMPVGGPGGGFGYNGVDGNRGQYGQHSGPAAPPNAPHRSFYGRAAPPSVGYEPGAPMGQGQAIGPPGQHGMGGDYMRRSGSNPNPPPGGYIDRYSAPDVNQRGNGYSARVDSRESEYDPAAVMPSHRGPTPNYGNSWNRDVPPVNRDMYGDRPPPPHQPAVARDRNGGFQTIGGGPQIYPGGTGGAAANTYGYDRSQNQGPPGGQYGSMTMPTGYDTRQNAYPGAQPPAPYEQYGPPQGVASMPPPGSGGANRYSGGMYNDPQQAYLGNAVGGMYPSGATGSIGRGGGWSDVSSSQQHPNAMTMQSPNVGGPAMSAGVGHGQGGQHHGGPGGQMAMHNGAGGQMHVGQGGHPGINGYGVPSNHGNANSAYMDRDAGGMGGSNLQSGGNNESNTALTANVLSTNAIDIKKLTNLISTFQQKQAAAESPSRGQMRSGQSGQNGGEHQAHLPYPSQQYQGQQGHQGLQGHQGRHAQQRNNGQQGYYR